VVTTKQQINEAEGSYKVYLAIKGDDNLRGKFRCTTKGVQYYNKKQMTEPDFSEISVYLAKNWKIIVSREDLKSGIMAASARIEPGLIYGTQISDEFRVKVEKFLFTNQPSFRRYDITTDAVAIAVDPIGFEHQRRLTEMRIAKALRANGLQKVRVTHEGKRKMRWFPIKGA